MSSLFNWLMPSKKKFGWIPHEDRTSEQTSTHQALVAQMPPFKLTGAHKLTADKVVLWDLAKKVTGKHLACFSQPIGDCTGEGKAKAEWYLQCCQVARGTHSHVVMPYEPYGYAMGRVAAGITGNEDGGTGSGCAEAAKKYGVLRSDYKGLPAWKVEGETVFWSGPTCKSWGQHGAPTNWVSDAKHFPVKTTALVSTAQQVAEAIQNYYPVTIASNWGGSMQPGLQGTPQVRLNPHADTWNHQMMVCGWWKHPTLGEIFYVQNSWGEDAFPPPASDEPPGGFWIRSGDMNYITRQQDSFAYSSMTGFPTTSEIDWVFTDQ